MKPSSEIVARELESLIHRDPAHRGLLSQVTPQESWLHGELLGAAQNLAQTASDVLIVTGFYIPRGQPPAPETDGPLGALLLADVLTSLGVRVGIVTDEICRESLARLFRLFGLGCVGVLGGNEWVRRFGASGGECSWPLSHLIAIERVGPSHSLESFLSQPRFNTAPREFFSHEVPLEEQGCCFNMCGESLEGTTEPLHHWFEDWPAQRPGLRTIGIGDGGNEIGMGKLPWETLAERLAPGSPRKIVCRTACDWNVIAGTSNWGAFALAAMVAVKRNATHLLRSWSVQRHRELLQRFVVEGPAVDGVTRRQEPTVDGLPFLTYIQPWEGMLRYLGLSD